LLDVAEEPRVQIIIFENIAARKNLARTILLATTMRKDPKSIQRNKI
jgi:hypothetical protein